MYLLVHKYIPTIDKVKIEESKIGLGFFRILKITPIIAVVNIVHIVPIIFFFLLSFSLIIFLLLDASYPGVSNPHRYIGTLPKHSSPNR